MKYKMSKIAVPLLGKEIKPYGKLLAIYWLDGERYYFFGKNQGREIVLLPAITIDELIRNS